jgi:hypothetical protein
MLRALLPVLGMAFNLSPNLAGQTPPHCAQILFCQFNQEAAATNSVGIHKYSEDLVGAILPNPTDDEAVRRLLSRLADRIANAEQAARSGNGRLVPEATVVKSFNSLMREVGAPSSLRTDEAALHGFREHAISIKAFHMLFSADRNGTSCNPGEAVFLLSLLISNEGKLPEQLLDSAAIQMRLDGQQSGGGLSFATAGMEPLGSTASGSISSYSSHHNLNENNKFFNQLIRRVAPIPVSSTNPR